MNTKDTVHLTLFVLSINRGLLGYTTIKADDLWDRARTRTSARVLFPAYVLDQFWQDGALLDAAVSVNHIAKKDSDGWALVPELTVNLAHVLFARTIPDGEVRYRLSGGNYQLKIGGEND